MEKLNIMEWYEMRMINEMKWGWFEVPVKGEQMNPYLFSDTTKIKKIKSGKKMSP
jgi:hypothetical protein